MNSSSVPRSPSETTPESPGGADDRAAQKRERYRREDRLRKQKEFERVYNQRQRAGDNVLLIYAVKNDLGHARLGLSVSRKVGNAVHRGRWKRLIREAFRRNRAALPANLDLIVIPRPGMEPELQAVRESLIALARRLGRRLEEPLQGGRNQSRGQQPRGRRQQAKQHDQQQRREPKGGRE